MSLQESYKQEHLARRARLGAVGKPQWVKPAVKALPPPPKSEPEHKPLHIYAIEDIATKQPIVRNGSHPIKLIQRIVCRHFHVSRVDMCSARKTNDIVIPRHVAMYLSKRLTHHSLPEIGRRFGNRDHTTVLHAFNKMTMRMVNDFEFAKEVDSLATQIRLVLFAESQHLSQQSPLTVLSAEIENEQAQSSISNGIVERDDNLSLP